MMLSNLLKVNLDDVVQVSSICESIDALALAFFYQKGCMMRGGVGKGEIGCRCLKRDHAQRIFLFSVLLLLTPMSIPLTKNTANEPVHRERTKVTIENTVNTALQTHNGE